MDSSDSGALGAVISIIMVLLFSAVIYVWLSFALSKVFAKVGEPTWKAWVPVLNYIVLFKLGGYTPIWVATFFLPIVNIVGAVFLVLSIHNINKRFSLGIGYTVLAWFALPVWASIVGFGSAQWGAAPAVAGGDAAFQSRVGGMIQPQPHYGAPQPVNPSVPVPPAPIPPAPIPPAPQPPTPQPPVPQFGPPQPTYPQPTSPVAAQLAPPAPTPPAPIPPAPTASVAPPAPPVVLPEPAEPVERPSEPVVTQSVAEALNPQPAEHDKPTEPKEPVEDEQPAPDAPAAAGGDPWAPPINSIPGVAVSAPAEPLTAAPAQISPPPVSTNTVAPKKVAPVVITPPPAAASAPPLDFDDTVIADALPDFDDTVIVGRKAPVWILEPTGSKVIRITSEVALLGRNPSVNAAFPDAQLVLVPDSSKTMSKNHARIALAEGVWTIYDLNSTNGVVLIDGDGEETVLEPGSSAILTETSKLGELPIRLTPES